MTRRHASILVISLYLFSLSAILHSQTEIEPSEVLESSSNSLSSHNSTTRGWLASASGDADIVFNDILTVSSDLILAGGHFQQTFFFNGEISGHTSNDTQGSPQDMLLAFLHSNGTWNRSMSFQSNGVDSIAKIGLFSDGDIAIAGHVCIGTFGFDCSFEPEPLNELGKFTTDEEGFGIVGRISPDGIWRWVQPFYSEVESLVVDMNVHSDDTISVAFQHSTPLIVENQFYIVNDGNSVLYARLNETGNVSQTIQYTSDSSISDRGCMASSNDGFTYLGLTFQSQINADFELYNASGGSDILISKINSEGILWNVLGGGADDEIIQDCILSQTNLRFVGSYFGAPTFGSFTLSNAQWVDIFDVSLNENGEWLSARSYGGPGKDAASSIVETSQGETYFAGTTSASITFGSTTLADLSPGDDSDVFLALQKADGSWDWSINAGGSGYDNPTDLILGPSKDPVLALTTTNDGVYGPNDFTYWGSGSNAMLWLFGSDRDEDGILDGEDNCPLVPNVDQANHDLDAFGNACDDDDDNDGVQDGDDDCNPGKINWISNAMTDHDSDGCYDDTEDFDDDEDGIFDEFDLCPKGPVGWVSTTENDVEGDGCSDIDSDGDGFVDQADNCPNIENPNQKDLDGDGIGNLCDEDEDGDGISIPQDLCPKDAVLWSSNIINDYDQDGCQDDINDEDDDNDEIPDDEDACPKGEIDWDADPTASDHDGDGCTDSFDDDDDDGDGVLDSADNCPRGVIGFLSNIDDKDGDGCLDSSEDTDDDNDGVEDALDQCPMTGEFDAINAVGCSQSQLDDDGDGINNIQDLCLSSTPGVQVDDYGCEVVQSETDTNSSEEESNDSMLFVLVLVLIAGVIGLVVYKDQIQPTQAKQYATQPQHPSSQESEAVISSEEQSSPEIQSGEEATDDVDEVHS
ncbi:MAG: thrombospondin type 3 repeat-containing protein [Candidatus Poseidoniales archaeon]